VLFLVDFMFFFFLDLIDEHGEGFDEEYDKKKGLNALLVP